MNNSKRIRTLTLACLLGGLLVMGVVNGLRTQAQATTSGRPSAVWDVVINEVAWGGTAAKGSDAWIELYNHANVPPATASSKNAATSATTQRSAKGAGRVQVTVGSTRCGAPAAPS